MVVNAYCYVALQACDIHSALDVFDFYKSGKVKILPQAQIGRSLLTACYMNGMDASAEDLFLLYNKTGCYPSQDITTFPKCIHMPSAVTSAEVELIIKDFIIELYKYLCDQMLEGRKLMIEDIDLTITIEWKADNEIITFPFMNRIPRTGAAVIDNICRILSAVQPPLTVASIEQNSIHIEPSSVEHYLQCRDVEGRFFPLL